ncbi:MAG: DEAD/DEAH box helicase [Peptostreptococcaceae bacterium]
MISLDIKKALKILGYNDLTVVQEKVIPKLINYKSIVVKSQTGSGKTASFSIPICENIDINNEVQALIIVPTRELSIQVSNEISNIGIVKKIRSEAIYGKSKIKEQINSLKQRVQVIVSTPGRLIDLINREAIDLSNLKYLIIDEADKMLNKGFIDDMKFLFDNVNDNVTVGLFSATFDQNVESFSNKYIKNFDKIEIEKVKNESLIDEKLLMTKDKYDSLKKVIFSKNPTTTLVFVNTKDMATKLFRRLKKDKFNARELSGDMSQEKRIFTINDFKDRKFNVLVSTDVASRGIHIDEIDLVINYDVPRDTENYVHRIGRTGRYKSSGVAVSIHEENELKYVKEIEEYIGKEIEYLEDFDKEELSQLEKAFLSKKVGFVKEVKDEIFEITKIYLNCGKRKKIRNVDILGALNNIDGIENSDIGVIKITDDCSYVDILNHKANIIIKKREIIIKRRTVKVRKDRG